MSPMHQAPSAHPSPHSHLQGHRPTAGGSQGRAGGLERKVYLKSSPRMVRGCSEGTKPWWPRAVALAAPVHLPTMRPGELWASREGKTPVVHFGHGESVRTPVFTAGLCAGVSPTARRCCCQLRWAQGDRPRAGRQRPGEVVSTVSITDGGTGLGMSRLSLQPCALRGSCSSA